LISNEGDGSTSLPKANSLAHDRDYSSL